MVDKGVYVLLLLLGFLVLCSIVFNLSLPLSFASAMAKNRNKKKRNTAVAMDVTEQTVFDGPQAMDTSESGAKSSAAGAANRNIRKGRPMKRTKNVRKMKAMAKAVSKNEQTVEKASKNDSKTVRTQSAKTLYD